jgi:hypothetical protein
VGRVLAHELYHTLTGDKHHGAKGIARAGLTPEELLADNFRFDVAQVRRLRGALIPARLSAYGWSGKLK